MNWARELPGTSWLIEGAFAWLQAQASSEWPRQSMKTNWCESLSCLIVGMKNNMVPGKLRSQTWAAMTTGNNFCRLKSERLEKKPMNTWTTLAEVGTKAKGTWCMRWDFQVRGGRHAMEQLKVDVVPRIQELKHHWRSRQNSKFRQIGWSRLWKHWSRLIMRRERYNLAKQPWWHDANGQWGTPVCAWYTSIDPTMTESAPVKHKACPLEGGPPEPLSLTQCPKLNAQNH